MDSGDLRHNYVCGLCHRPARAGKTAARSAEAALAAA
jgi:hypothetical protein